MTYGRRYATKPNFNLCELAVECLKIQDQEVNSKKEEQQLGLFASSLSFAHYYVVMHGPLDLLSCMMKTDVWTGPVAPIKFLKVSSDYYIVKHGRMDLFWTCLKSMPSSYVFHDSARLWLVQKS